MQLECILLHTDLGHAFPPDPAVVCEGDVGEDCVLHDGLHGDGVGVHRSAGRNSEESVLRVDGAQIPVLIEPVQQHLEITNPEGL